MLSIPFYQVDAFTKKPFAGNPAAVCPLDTFFDDGLLQRIAMENNLSETAFFTRNAEHPGDYDLRWFTPTVEVDLCGHATLASAFVLMTELDRERTRAVFHTKSGALTVQREGSAFTLDFPALRLDRADTPIDVIEALGARPDAWLLGGGRAIAVFPTAEAVRALHPSFAKLAALGDVSGLAVTAPGDGRDADVDFVSRYFAPARGIDEDPVTGSAHCALAPYWAERLGNNALRARQVSARGGELACVVDEARVKITGHAVLVVRGTMMI